MTSPLITIDSESTRDIDDAFSISQVDGGPIVLTIAIADPCDLVAPGSELDDRALQQVCSVYRRDRTVAKMLPSAISEHRASLVAGKKRDALVMKIVLRTDLTMESFGVSFEKVQVTHRLHHDEAPKILRSTEHELHTAMKLAAAICTQLLDQRRKNGALALYDMTRLLVSDEEGRLQFLEKKEDVIGYIIVQELMILANVSMAAYMAEHNIPAIYRNHVPKMAAPSSLDLAATMQSWIESGGDLTQIAQKLQASLGKASYESVIKGHYGLSVPSYLHMTSPLRRYVDLINLRQLKAFCTGQQAPYGQDQLIGMAEHVNQTLLERGEAQSTHFKSVVRSEAQELIAAGNLLGAKNEVLVQAIKIAAAEGAMQPVLSAELCRLMMRGVMEDKVADALMTDLPISAWNAEVMTAYVHWLKQVPSRAMHAMVHGQQTKTFECDIFSSSVPGDGFNANCTIVRDGNKFSGEQQELKRKDAEQSALIMAITGMLQMQSVTPALVAPAKAEIPSISNTKGTLLELCQKRKWHPPVFTHQSSGPSHQMTFECSLVLETPQETLREKATGATKKMAEAKVSEMALEKLLSSAKPAKPANPNTQPNPQAEDVVPPAPAAPEQPDAKASNSSAADTTNYKGMLLEKCQKHRWPAPHFETVAQGPGHQMEFHTKVVLKAGPIAHEGISKASTRKAAEAMACKNLLAQLSTH